MFLVSKSCYGNGIIIIRQSSHCKDSHTLHIKNGSKSKPIFTKNLNYFEKNNFYANNGVHFKIVSIIINK